MNKLLLATIFTVSISAHADDKIDSSLSPKVALEPVGIIIQRQVFAEEPKERFILTQTKEVSPQGSQTCNNQSCNTRINNWSMETAEPLYFLSSSIKITCNEKIKKYCERFGGYQLGGIADRSVTFTTMDKSPIIQAGHGIGVANTYTVSASLMIKEPKTTKGAFNPQDIYSGLKFYVNIPDSAMETELIGYHKKHGPFLIDPLIFTGGYGIRKIETEIYPGGKRITFIVDGETN